jgi:hypothetical protein
LQGKVQTTQARCNETGIVKNDALRGFATNYANILALAKAGETVGVDKDPRFLDLMALALALVGIFSLVAYSVAQAHYGVRRPPGARRAARKALVSAAAGHCHRSCL